MGCINSCDVIDLTKDPRFVMKQNRRAIDATRFSAGHLADVVYDSRLCGLGVQVQHVIARKNRLTETLREMGFIGEEDDE